MEMEVWGGEWREGLLAHIHNGLQMCFENIWA